MLGKRLTAIAAFLAAALVTTQGVAQSSNPFAPLVVVNDRTITNYELAQRISMMRLLRAPGNIEEVALDDLINDRLRLDAANQMGLEIPLAAVEAGMEEFASRANLSTEEFTQALQEGGVSPETFRDFVTAGVAWRQVVRERFGPRTQITESEIDRALALTSRRGGAVAQLAEIVLPARDEAELEASQAKARELSDTITSVSAFAAAARQFSLAPSAPRGGRMERSTPLAELPPGLRSQILTLAPGGITEPLTSGNAVIILQLIELRETGVSEPDNVTLEFVRYLIPGGRTEATLAQAQKVINATDTCDDLYGANLGQSPDRLIVETLPASEVPRDVALELAKLDAGEISTALTQGGALVVLMLCSRTAVFEEAPDRENVRQRLFAQRVASYGDGYLAQLRAEAIIRYP